MNQERDFSENWLVGDKAWLWRKQHDPELEKLRREVLAKERKQHELHYKATLARRSVKPPKKGPVYKIVSKAMGRCPAGFHHGKVVVMEDPVGPHDTSTVYSYRSVRAGRPFANVRGRTVGACISKSGNWALYNRAGGRKGNHDLVHVASGTILSDRQTGSAQHLACAAKKLDKVRTTTPWSKFKAEGPMVAHMVDMFGGQKQLKKLAWIHTHDLAKAGVKYVMAAINPVSILTYECRTKDVIFDRRMFERKPKKDYDKAGR